MSDADAIAYAARGWPVFPLATEGRDPLVKWSIEATTDVQTIEAWWRRWPRATIGVQCAGAGIVVLDIDVKHRGQNGFDTLEELGKAILPETPMVHTPSGGLHIYFRANPAVEIRNSAGERGLGPSLDIRGVGGMVPVPCAGSRYTWDPHLNLDTVALHPAPRWLGHRTKRSPSRNGGRELNPQAILAVACSNIRAAANGTRHDTLNREAFIVGKLVAASALPEREAWHQLEAATAAMTWGTRGDQRKAASDLVGAFRDGLAQPRSACR